MTGALGGGLALAVMIYATAGAPVSRARDWTEQIPGGRELRRPLVNVLAPLPLGVAPASESRAARCPAALYRCVFSRRLIFTTHALMDHGHAGDNGSGGKLNPAVTAGLLITGGSLIGLPCVHARVLHRRGARWGPLEESLVRHR